MDISKIQPISGIYKIKCVKNNRIYVGRSANIRCRAFEHKLLFERNTHYNKIMQNSFNKYGIETFELSIVEEVSRNRLHEREKYWSNFYNTFDTKYGFNICPIEENQANLKGNKEHAEKVMGEKNGKAKLNNKVVKEICKIINKKENGAKITYTEIGNKYNVTCNAVTSIKSGRTWGNISKKYLNQEIIESWSEKNKKKWL